MSDLPTRLRQHVDTAAPPIDVDALVRQLEEEPLVLAAPPTRRRFPDWALAVVVAAVVLVVVGGAALLFAGGTSVEPADTVPPVSTVPRLPVKAATVYDLETDDLCEWLTAGEMDQIVAYAQQQAGTEFAFGSLVDPVPAGHASSGTSGLCWGSAGWTENPAAEGSILIALSSYFDDQDASADRDWFDANPQWFDGHPLLDDAVAYHVSRHNVAFDAGVQLQLRVDGHDDVLVFAFGVGDEAAVATPTYETLGLAIANELLRQMNWIEN